LLLFVVAALGLQNPIDTAILAMVLGIAALVGAILDDTGAAALATPIGDGSRSWLLNYGIRT